MSKTVLIKSSLVKKYWMALTGLFLCLFLLGHLFGNLQLLISDVAVAREKFNEYAHFMTSNPLIKVLSYLTYLSVIFHVIDGLALTIANRRARKGRYVVHKSSANSSYSSRNMGFLGSVILVFLVVHMRMFWGEMHFGDMEVYQTAHGEALKDLYSLTVRVFQDESFGLAWALGYGLCMVALGFHLGHGFSSAFQSLGIGASNPYKKLIILAGKGFAIAVPFLFGIIPFYIHFVLNKI